MVNCPVAASRSEIKFWAASGAITSEGALISAAAFTTEELIGVGPPTVSVKADILPPPPVVAVAIF